MKKIKLFICSIMVSLLLFSSVSNAYDPTTDVHYDQVLNGNYYVEDNANFTQTDLDMINYCFMVTPYATQDLFVQEGVRIYFTRSVPQSARSYSNGRFDAICYSATYSYNGNKKITKVSAPVSIYIYSNTNRADAYIHECGHAYDDLAEYITGYYQGSHPISNSSEWQALYSQNAGIMATFDESAAINVPINACEGFAEAYRLYYVYPQQLSASCPGVYNYVAAQIAKYQGYIAPITYDNFDYEFYALAYPDVAAACGNDRQALWNHYVNYGKAEGRVAKKRAK